MEWFSNLIFEFNDAQILFGMLGFKKSTPYGGARKLRLTLPPVCREGLCNKMVIWEKNPTPKLSTWFMDDPQKSKLCKGGNLLWWMTVRFNKGSAKNSISFLIAAQILLNWDYVFSQWVLYTLPWKILSPPVSVWSKTTLNTDVLKIVLGTTKATNFQQKKLSGKPAPPTLPVLRVVLLHKEADGERLFIGSV